MKCKKVFAAMAIVGAIVCGGSADFPSFTPSVQAYGGEIIPGNHSGSFLWGKFPYIGGTEGMNIYWDESSCYAATDGNIATLACIVYFTSTDGGPYGPSHVTPVTITFQTYKYNGLRTTKLTSAVSNAGKDYENFLLNNDKGFLNNLFWKIANTTGMAVNLD